MVNTSEDQSWKIVNVSKILKDENANDLRVHLLNLFNEEHLKVRFDFSSVRNINTKTLNIFAIFSKLIEEQVADYQLEIINANDDIINLFQMTHMEKTYKIILSKTN